MQQVVVPQFIDAENKVIGSITVRQFLELMIGGLLIFVFYKIFDFSLFVISGLLVLFITIIFAFTKINGQAFHYFLLNFIQTMKNPKLKIWRKTVSNRDIKEALAKPPEEFKARIKMAKTTPTVSRLSELALVVDTGGVYQGESGLAKIEK